MDALAHALHPARTHAIRLATPAPRPRHVPPAAAGPHEDREEALLALVEARPQRLQR